MEIPPDSPPLAPLDRLRVDPANTALLVVDVQSKLSAVMPPIEMAAVERNLLLLIELARRQHWPVIWSEQYPKGLGATLPALADALAAPDLDVARIEKLTLACTDHPPFEALRARMGRRRFVVAGMEAHVCVWQTVRGLRGHGHDVFLPVDAVISRDPRNHAIGVDLAARAGAIVSSTEAIAFDALGRAGTDDFRAISRLLK